MKTARFGAHLSNAFSKRVLTLLIPIVVAVAVLKLSEKRLLTVLGLGVALAVLGYFVRRPGAALVVLAVFLPLQPLGFGLLLRIHVPASLLKPSSSFKELLGISVLLAALRAFRDGQERLDRLDAVLLAYVAVVTVFLAFPHLFTPDGPTIWKARVLAWRSDCGYVLVAFAARHAPITTVWKRRFFNTILVMGAITVVGALYQLLATSSWNTFVLKTARQPEYLQKVIGSLNADSLRYIYHSHPLHVGSIFLSPYDMSDYLTIVAAVALEKVTSKTARPAVFVLLGGVVTAIFFSRVRADALALVIILALASLPEVRRPVQGRIRLVLALIIGAAIVIPSLGGTRFVGAQGGNKSTTGHVKEIQRGITYLVDNPLGLGLGYQPATIGDIPGYTGASTNLTTDNSVTQVGDELGFEALIPWVLLMVMVMAKLRKRGRKGEGYAVAAGLGLLGVLISGQYHHVFLLYPVPWTLWAAVGLALNDRGRHPDRSVRAPTREIALDPVGAGALR